MIRIFSAAEFEQNIPRFADILIDAVDSGAGVSFLKPLAKIDAETFWHGQLSSVANGQTLPIVAQVEDQIAGLVLLVKAWAPNQPHRCDIAKLLVHRDFRRNGIATELIKALEEKARELNQTMITFDAVAKSPAAHFYISLGFICVGTYPKFAYSGDGVLDDTALFYKEL